METPYIRQKARDFEVFWARARELAHPSQSLER